MTHHISKSAIALLAMLVTSVPAGLAGAEEPETYRFHDDGQPGDDHLRFELTSTKAGFITTGVGGRVRDFSLSYERDGDGVRNARIIFPVRAMTTDNGGRDQKMWGFCLDAEHHPNVEVEIRGPLPATTHGDVLGRIKIRGQWHPVPVTLTTRPTAGGSIVEGHAVVSLSRLGIPDPSIWIANVRDDVRIQFHMAVPSAPPATAHARS